MIVFPILGGRLLKKAAGCNLEVLALFPILGGRLLKKKVKNMAKEIERVSNPWREAIEGIISALKFANHGGFQSLEGGY